MESRTNMEKLGILQKNDFVTVTIEDMGVSGEGIGKVDGFPLFIKDAIIGDVIQATITKMKKGYGYAKLDILIEPSPFRIEAKCPMHKQCGGCQIQCLDYEQQLKLKEKMVSNHLIRIGGVEEPPMAPIIGMNGEGEEPFFYRNKAQYPVGTDRDGRIVVGFYAKRSHTIIPYRNCLLGAAENETILDQVITYMEEESVSAYDEIRNKGLVRHILIRKGFATGEIMVCIVINGVKLPAAETLIGKLKKISGMTSIAISSNQQVTNVIMGETAKTIWGSPVIHDSIGEINFEISPLSFFQVNPIQTQKLYAKVMEFAQLTGEEIVWDLYCGIGTISLFLAKCAKQVYGVEIIPQAIEDAKQNAQRNQIANAEYFAGKVEDVLIDQYTKYPERRGDVIVVDPPRKGLDEEVIKTMIAMQPERIVYVSCDSATLARDVKIFIQGGYEVKSVQPVDMFPQTVHVETIVALHRKDT